MNTLNIPAFSSDVDVAPAFDRRISWELDQLQHLVASAEVDNELGDFGWSRFHGRYNMPLFPGISTEEYLLQGVLARLQTDNTISAENPIIVYDVAAGLGLSMNYLVQRLCTYIDDGLVVVICQNVGFNIDQIGNLPPDTVAELERLYPGFLSLITENVSRGRIHYVSGNLTDMLEIVINGVRIAGKIDYLVELRCLIHSAISDIYLQIVTDSLSPNGQLLLGSDDPSLVEQKWQEPDDLFALRQQALVSGLNNLRSSGYCQ